MNEKKTLSPLFVEIVRFDDNDMIATSGLRSLFSTLANDNTVELSEITWQWE